MHSLDPLLKSLILKAVVIAIIGIAGVLSIPAGIFLSRRFFKNKSRRFRIVGAILISGMLFSVTAVALVVAGLVTLAVTVINPEYKQKCAGTMQEIVQKGSVWASSHDGRFPSDFTFLNADRRFVFVSPCARKDGDNDQEAAQRSYQIVTPGAPAGDGAVIFLRCPSHEHSVRINGTIIQDQPRS